MSEVLRADSPAVEFPTSDGRPVAETPLHYRCLSDLAYCLTAFFRRRADAYVGVNMLAYDDPKEPRRHLSPDIFVAFGGLSEEEREREIYKLWEEPSPAFVLEVTSRSTRATDQGSKRQVYAKLGVCEYWRFDPTGDYLDPPLVGERLKGDRYVRLPLDSSREGSLAGRSTVLGLDLTVAQGRLRFRDSATGEALPASDELERRVVQETRAREAAEARAARTEARLRALQDISSDPPGRAIE